MKTIPHRKKTRIVQTKSKNNERAEREIRIKQKNAIKQWRVYDNNNM